MARRRTSLLIGLAAVLTGLGLTGTPVSEAADQTISVRVLPPVSQPGAKAGDLAKANAVLAVSVQPATAGRRVVLSRQDAKKGWQAVDSVTLDARGLAAFAVAAARPTPVGYRVTAEAASSLLALTTTTTVSTSTWGSPDFADEFAGIGLGPAWTTRGTAYNPAGLRACSKGSPQAVAVSGGVARLSVVADPTRSDLCTAYRKDGSLIGQYRYRLNGHIGTQLSADLRYGVAAARVRFQQSRGQHGAFWLQPTAPAPGSTSPATAGAEIDVVEWFGDGGANGGLSSGIYYPSPAGQVQAGGWVSNPSSYLSSSGDSWWSGFHVFSVEWTPTAYVFRIDGRETWRTSEGVSGTPEYLILSLLSSDYELPLLGGEDRLPQHLDVDWAAFWEA